MRGSWARHGYSAYYSGTCYQIQYAGPPSLLRTQHKAAPVRAEINLYVTALEIAPP